MLELRGLGRGTWGGGISGVKAASRANTGSVDVDVSVDVSVVTSSISIGSTVAAAAASETGTGLAFFSIASVVGGGVGARAGGEGRERLAVGFTGRDRIGFFFSGGSEGASMDGGPAGVEVGWGVL